MLIKELCRFGASGDETSCKWRAKFGGMQVSEAQRMREIESENAKPKSAPSSGEPSIIEGFFVDRHTSEQVSNVIH